MSRTPSTRAAAIAGALLVVLAGSAFVRSTTANPQNPAQGLCAWWAARTIHYVVNMAGLKGQGCASQDAAVAEVQAAFQTWHGASRAGPACTDLAFVPDGVTTTETELGFDPTPGAKNVNLVVMRQGPCSIIVPTGDPCLATPGACVAPYNCWEHSGGGLSANTLALTTTTLDTATGEIVDADVELNGWNGNTGAPQDGSAGWYYTCGTGTTCADPPYTQSSCTWTSVQNTMTHEVGHVIGLDHTCVGSYPPPYNACPASVMAATAAHGDLSRLTLGADDVNAICSIYPAGQATVTCVPPPPSKGGCSTGEAGVAALAGLALAAALGRRRGATR
jgi:hypothetical protein